MTRQNGLMSGSLVPVFEMVVVVPEVVVESPQMWKTTMVVAVVELGV